MPASSTAAGYPKPKSTCFRTRTRPRRRQILAELDDVPGRKLLISDGVFSMDGDIGPLPGLVEAAEKHGAIMMVDDAHASGVLGRNGPRHGRSLRPAWARAYPGGDALQSHRGAGRVRVRQPRPDRVSVSSRAAVSVFHLASAGGGGGVYRRVRCAGAGAGAHRAALGQHAVLQAGARRGGFQHGHQRDADHAGDGGRGEAGARAFAGAVRGAACWRRASDIPRCRRARHGCGPS